VSIKRVVAAAAIAGLSFSSIAFAAENETALERQQRLDAIERLGAAAPMMPVAGYVPREKRPVALPALYATLGAMQAWDLYSTSAALTAGAKEANPTASPFAGSPSSLIGLKAATTASTIFFAERMWKKNKVGAVVMMVAINGATAAVSMHNMRNARAVARQ